MAGDYIPMQIDLHKRLEVAKIATKCRCSRYEVVGMLLKFWGWVSTETVDGVVDVSVDGVVEVVSLPKHFILALRDVGWLEIGDTTVTVPKFERWLSEGAK